MNRNQPDITLPKQTKIRVYTARIYQSASAAPTAQVKYSTLAAPIEWIRVDVGNYAATGQFPNGIIMIENSNEAALFTAGITDDFEANLHTTDLTGTPIDGALNGAYVEIRSYNENAINNA